MSLLLCTAQVDLFPQERVLDSLTNERLPPISESGRPAADRRRS